MRNGKLIKVCDFIQNQSCVHIMLTRGNVLYPSGHINVNLLSINNTRTRTGRKNMKRGDKIHSSLKCESI